MQKTVIFDMDGVLFDTEALYMKCWEEIAEVHQITGIHKVVLQCIGTNDKKTKEILLSQFGSDFAYETYRNEISECFMSHVRKEGMPMKPGVRELLTYLRGEGYRIGLATSTRWDRVEEELRMMGLLSYFPVIVCGDMVTKSKPDPEIFITCAKKLKAKSEEIIVIEDSYNGIRAASRAKMKPIMVPDLLKPTKEMESLSVAILPDLYAVKDYLSNST